MTVSSELAAQPPETSSADLLSQAAAAERLVEEAASMAATFRQLGESYEAAHTGPYITVVVAALEELGRACDRLGETYQDAAGGFRSAANGIDRINDRVETIRARFEEFRRLTEPILEYYRSRGKVAVISTEGPIDSVGRRVTDVLDALCDRRGSGSAAP